MQFLIDHQAVLTLGLLAVVAMMLGLVLMRRPGPGSAASDDLARTAERLAAADAQREALRDALEAQRIACGRLEAERDGLRTQIADLEEEIESVSTRLSDRERDVSALKVVESRLAGERDTLKTECEKAAKACEGLEEKLRAEVETVKARDQRIGELNGTVQELTARLEAEREKYAALNQDLEKKSQQFVAQFEAISGKILQAQGKATTDAQKSELEKVISPFKAEIEGFKVNLKEMTDRAEKERQSLGTQLLVMQTEATKLADQANGLARALRGDKKVQGNWGELILERLLEAAGLQEGVTFTRQKAIVQDDGSRIIPDVIVHLPGRRDVIIDSKVSLVAYQDMIRAEDKGEEAAALRQHVQAIRAHIKRLSEKRYETHEGSTVDSVTMFVPNDGALNAALGADSQLVTEAAEMRITLMSPTTLVHNLMIVAHLWTIDRRNRNVDDIVDRAGKLHDKFVAVVDSVQKIGEHLKKASHCQEEALKQMSEGRGNVIGQVDKLRQLGAKAKKAVPAELLADHQEETETETTEAAAAPRGAPALAAG